MLLFPNIILIDANFMTYGLLDCLEVFSKKSTPMNLNLLTVALLLVISLLACTLKNVLFVLAFAGATHWAMH
jgi:hypothetical protein